MVSSHVAIFFSSRRKPRGVHHPSLIAHGGAFFWLRSHRLRGLELPPAAWMLGNKVLPSKTYEKP